MAKYNKFLIMFVGLIFITACSSSDNGGELPVGDNDGINPFPAEPLQPPPDPTGSVINMLPTSGRHVSPKIEFNALGVGLAVWESANGPPISGTGGVTRGRAIWYSIYKNNNWSQEQVLYADAHAIESIGPHQFQIQIAASSNGFAVVWNQYDKTNDVNDPYDTNVYARLYDGDNWSKITALDTLQYPASRPVVASNGSSYLVVWSQFSASQPVTSAIWGRFFSNGAWRAPREIVKANESHFVGSMQLASNGAGYALAWHTTNASTSWNNAKTFSNNNWGERVQFDDISLGIAGSPLLSASGNAYLMAWNSILTQDIYYANGSGTNWSSATQVGLNGSVSTLARNGQNFSLLYQRTGATAFDEDLVAVIYNGGSWGAEIPLESASGRVSHVFAVESDDGFAVAWRLRDEILETYDLYYTTFNNSAAQTPIVIHSTKISNELSLSPSSFQRENLVYNGIGAVLMWMQYDSVKERETIYAQSYTGFSAGERSELLQRDHDSSAHNPSITVSESGVKMATWEQWYFDTTSQSPAYIMGLFAAVFENQTWSQPHLIDRYSSGAQALTNGSSFALVYGDGLGRVAAVMYQDQSFGPKAILESGPGLSYDVQATSNGLGYIVVWKQNNSTDQIYANIYNGAQWQAQATPISTGAGHMPQLASNGTGYAVTWKHHDGITANNIYANVFDGNNWLGQNAVETTSPPASLPGIASDGSNYVIVWQQNDGVYASIFASFFSAGTWSAPVDIDNKDIDSGYASIASNGTNYVVVWRQNGLCYARFFENNVWNNNIDNLGACEGPRISNERSLKISADDSGYAMAFVPVNASVTAGMFATVYTNGGWQPIEAVFDSDCLAPTFSAWQIKSNADSHAVLSTCNGGLYANYDAVANVFRNGSWQGHQTIENGNSGVAHKVDLSSDGGAFAAIWSQAHESQDDPIAAKVYVRTDL